MIAMEKEAKIFFCPTTTLYLIREDGYLELQKGYDGLIVTVISTCY